MIKSIKIRDLFGRFDYAFETCIGGVTIITGPNGFGKSTILKIIESIGRGNLYFFKSFDFKEITIEYDNNQKTELKKDVNNFTIDNINLQKLTDVDIVERIPWMRRMGDSYIDLRNDELFSENDAYFHLLFDSDYVDKMNIKSPIFKELKVKIEQIRTWSGDVRIISDQRLIRQKKERRRDETQVIDVISELPSRLKAEITRVSEEYSKVANVLDGS